MKLSLRAKNIQPSITLKLNEKAVRMSESGKHVYNLTAGQLPFKPMPNFVEKLEAQLKFLKSYQYAPVPGFPELREKLFDYVENTRDVKLSDLPEEFDCIISNGAKHTIFNVLGALIDEGDEVCLIAPYWVSYPEMVKFWGGSLTVATSHSYDGFTPDIEELRKVLSNQTKVLILNSPNNPTGVHYSDQWMKDFANLLEQFPELIVISDEIYHELSYFDPRPTFFYQHNPGLLKRTVIVDGISKAFACTGLRIGFCLAEKELVSAINRIQGQTTSGANSLVQRALMDFDFARLQEFLGPVKFHLRNNAEILREVFRSSGLAKCWYQSLSAFYFTVDFARTPYFEKKYGDQKEDNSEEIAGKLLDETGVAVVPGIAFGAPNTARISIVLEESPFREAMEKLTQFLTKVD